MAAHVEGPVEISVTRDIECLASAWRELEASGTLTPYQRFAWVKAYASTVGTAHGLDLRYVTVQSRTGEPVAILPLEIILRHGVRMARFIGGKHANYHMPVFDRRFAAALTVEMTQRLLRDVATALGDVDALFFTNQPATWDGIDNPMTRIAAWPSPSDAYKLALSQDCDGTLARTMSTHARKKLKNKRHRLADFGRTDIFRALDPSQIDRLLDAFMIQKAERFALMGVANPFADPAIRAFLRAGTLEAVSGERPAIELYGLMLGDDILSTYVGAVHDRRFSGMATAYVLDHPAARTSPGEIFLVDLIKLKCREGYATFDLGVGEARYKTTICDGVDHLFDTFIAVTVKGRMLAGATRIGRSLKRTVKQHPGLLRMAQFVQARIRQPSAAAPGR